MRNLLRYSLLFGLLLGCTDDQKEQNLLQREQKLSEKETKFEAKEAEYKSLLALRDSLENSVPATPAVEELPAEIIGKWSGKMICTESSCTDNVIGDQRTDVWEFFANGLKMTNKTGGERDFTANIVGDELKLVSEESSNITNRSEITLSLTDLQNGRMKGTRAFIGKNECIAKFSVELEKSKN